MKLVIFLFALPLLGQQGVNLYSPEKERALGESLAAEIRRHSEPVRDPAIQTWVERTGGELVSRLEGERKDYRFEVVSGLERSEPCALPGGQVFVPASMFLTARDEHEFAGALAHAIAHTALRHGTRMASRGQVANMASIPVVFMGGCVDTHADPQRPRALLPVSFLPFQRANELEADRFGIELAARAGYDASAFLRYVEHTHPAADSEHSPLPPRESRIAALREALPSTAGGSRLATSEFETIRDRVRSMPDSAVRRRAPTLRR